MWDSTAKDERPKRRHRVYPQEFKQQVVKEALEPGASVSVVARCHDINANVVFEWRKRYREGKLPLSASNEALTLGVGASQWLAVDVRRTHADAAGVAGHSESAVENARQHLSIGMRDRSRAWPVSCSNSWLAHGVRRDIPAGLSEMITLSMLLEGIDWRQPRRTDALSML